MTAVAELELPTRWYPLRGHPAHEQLVNSDARFDVIEAGRRSGKTELAKRHGVAETRLMCQIFGRWYTKYCAPTLAQSCDIFWEDLLELSHPFWSRDPDKTNHRIHIRGGGQIWVCGLDRPQRIEGSPTNRMYVDELADVKDGAWDRNLRPALDTEQPGYPPARAWLFGVPRPGGQFAKLARLAKDPTQPDFAYHTWTSEGVLSPEKIAAAKRTMDSRVYAQEYLAQRVSMEGRAYYQFATEHNTRALEHRNDLALLICLDFNRSPGTAVLAQEQPLAGVYVAQCATCDKLDPGLSGAACAHCGSLLPLETCTCVIGEVFIESGSNISMVCTRICNDWRHHTGPVVVYGDPAGGAKTSSSVEGSDWELVRRYLKRDFPQAIYDVDSKHPPQRARVNAVNLRCCNTAGERRLFVDTRPGYAPNLGLDLEEQLVVKGGSGELEKDKDPMRGHCSDGLGYCIQKLYPADFGEQSSIEAA